MTKSRKPRRHAAVPGASPSARTNSVVSPVARPRYGESPWQQPGRSGENLQIFDFPTFLFGRVTGLIKRSLMASYTERFGLSIPEWRVLAALSAAPAGSFSEVCNVLTMDRAQVSRTLPSLVAKGFAAQSRVRREGPRRRGESEFQIRFTLTIDGRALFRRALPVARRHQMILLNALDEAERRALHNALLKVLSAAEQYEEFQHLHANPRRNAAVRRTKRQANAGAADGGQPANSLGI